MTYTVITNTDVLTVKATRYTQDSDGDVYFYDEPGDNADPVATVDSDEFVAVGEEDNIITPTQ